MPRPLALPFALALLVVPLVLSAQEAHRDADPRPTAECFRFAFGEWSPPLDWSAAGHEGPMGTGEQGAHGRENAAHTDRQRGPLLLFPAFWPAGVLIRFDERTRGDTLTGTATALVADAARDAPSARIRALRVPCARGESRDPLSASPRRF